MASRVRTFFTKSFLERSNRLIGLIGLVLIVVGTGVALLLSGGVFARTYPVKAVFTDAAGIVPGDKVTVAGLNAGTVKGLTIEDGKVVVQLAVSRGVELPAETRAEVVVQTLLGKRAINLVAGHSAQSLGEVDVAPAVARSGKTLEEVGFIPVDRTSTPVDIVELNDISVRLLDESDAPALNDLMAEVTRITDGQEDEVRQLIDGLNQVSTAIHSSKAELGHLLDSMDVLSTTLGEKSDTIVSLIDNLEPVLANLAARQEEIQQLLEVTDDASHETADLVVRNRDVLDSALNALHTDLTVIDRHQVDLAATLSYLEDAVQGYQSVGHSGGNCGRVDSQRCRFGYDNRWANIFVQSLGPLGVDALIGDCGAVDQLIDSMLGTKCDDSPSSSAGGGSTTGPPSQGGGGGGGSGPGLPPIPTPPGTGGGLPPIPDPTLPPIPGIGQSSYESSASSSSASSDAFPEDVGDFFATALYGWSAQ